MTGCSADYCTNSSSKGFQMFRFPQEEKRRKIWINNVNRADWVPRVGSRLCEIHFSDEMWEKTRDGKRRLKSAAVPTIFGNLVLVSTSVQEPMSIPAECHENYNNTSQEAQEKIPINNGDVHNEFAVTEETQIETEGREITEKFKETPFAKNNVSSTLKLDQRRRRLEKLYEKSDKSRKALKKNLLQPKKQIKKYQQEVRSNKLKENLSRILNEDQITFLTRD